MTNLTSSAFSSRYRIIAYWATTALLVFELALGGVWDILLSASGLISVSTMAYPIVMTCVAVASWALRPPSRRFGSG